MRGTLIGNERMRWRGIQEMRTAKRQRERDAFARPHRMSVVYGWLMKMRNTLTGQKSAKARETPVNSFDHIHGDSMVIVSPFLSPIASMSPCFRVAVPSAECFRLCLLNRKYVTLLGSYHLLTVFPFPLTGIPYPRSCRRIFIRLCINQLRDWHFTPEEANGMASVKRKSC